MIVTRDNRHPMEDRVRAALAEAGYPNAWVFVVPAGDTSLVEGPGWQGTANTNRPPTWCVWTHEHTSDYRCAEGAPLEVIWKAFVVAGLVMPCWKCWEIEMLAIWREPKGYVAPCLATGLGQQDCGAVERLDGVC